MIGDLVINLLAAFEMSGCPEIIVVELAVRVQYTENVLVGVLTSVGTSLEVAVVVPLEDSMPFC